MVQSVEKKLQVQRRPTSEQAKEEDEIAMKKIRKQIDKDRFPLVEIFETQDHGRGIRSTSDLENKTFVGHYPGSKMTKKIGEQVLGKHSGDKLKKVECYLFEFPVYQQGVHPKNCPITLVFGHRKSVVAPGKFINHSKKHANLKAVPVNIGTEEEPRVELLFYTTRNIAAGGSLKKMCFYFNLILIYIISFIISFNFNLFFLL